MLVTRCPWILRATAPLGAAAAMLVTNGAWAQDPPTAPPPTQTAAQALSQPPTPAKSGTFLPEELEQMVAPIALYPDPLIAQVLMSSTYPLEIVEAARWSKANPSLTGDAIAEALNDQDWDPSVKSIATFPDVLAMMDEKLDWTQKLGDAFLAQQAEVMDAVQRLRAKAKAEGTLMSSKEQTVTEEPVPPPAAPAADAAAAPAVAAAPAAQTTTTTIIKIEPADPQVVYVPTYNPTIVYGAWPYPAYPPYYYYPPMYPPGAAFFSFTAGVIVGGALWGNCNWGGSDIDINVNRNTNINNIGNNSGNRNNVGNNAGNRGGAGNNAAGVGNNAAGVSNNAAGGGKWNHDPSHRKGAQYRDSATQNKFGKGQSANNVQSREAFRGRAEQGRQDIAAGGATRDLAGNQLGGQGGNRAGTQPAGGNRAGTQPSAGNRAGGQGGAAAGTRPTQPSSANRASTANRSSTSRGSEAFRSSSSGSATRSASQRGYSSRSSGGFSGGGMSRGGGGMRGGGGRR